MKDQSTETQDQDQDQDQRQDRDRRPQQGRQDQKQDQKQGQDNQQQGMDDKDDKDQAVSPEKKRKIRTILIVVGVILLIAGVGWYIWHEVVGKYHESTDDAYIQSDAVTVSPKVGGYVDAVLVNENQDVQAGQALVRIDPRDYRAQTEQYQAQIEIAKANADAVRAQIAEQESAVAGARAQLAAAQANAGYASSEVQRYAPLVQIGAENDEALATRRNQAKQAAEQVATQRAALANAEKRIASLQAQVRQAEAQGGTAKAQLQAADVNLQSTTIGASIAGRIGDLTVRVGQFVQPGTRMMSLVPMSHLYITANFKETQIGLMRIGQPAQIKVDALSGVKLRGHVESIAPGTGAQFSLLPPQNATGNFTKIVQRVPVRIALEADPDTRALLVPGLSVKVEVETKSAKDQIDQIKDRQKQESKQIKQGDKDEQKEQRRQQEQSKPSPAQAQARAEHQAQVGH
jgi:membrane fusion protein (multidrug efflux system)